MPRYILRRPQPPKADSLDEDRGPFTPLLMVDLIEPYDTGLLGPDGETVWHHPEPIGFLDNLGD
jgi:hypothetical protein